MKMTRVGRALHLFFFFFHFFFFFVIFFKKIVFLILIFPFLSLSLSLFCLGGVICAVCCVVCWNAVHISIAMSLHHSFSCLCPSQA